MASGLACLAGLTAFMLTDVFINRYRFPICLRPDVPANIANFFVQAAHIIFSDLGPALVLEDEFFININETLSREVGAPSLMGSGRGQESVNFLVERYELWNNGADALVRRFAVDGIANPVFRSI
jgi:hypothetical protein